MDFYIECVEVDGVCIKYVLEMYFYVDFVFGYLDLANKIGVIIVFGFIVKLNFEVYIVIDGEELKVGNVIVKVLYIFGYMMEFFIFFLFDEEGKEYVIFMGDIFFLGDVGCFDLVVKIDLFCEDFVGYLFDSFCNKIMFFLDEVIVYFGYGVGFVCGKKMSFEIWGYLGDQKKINYVL